METQTTNFNSFLANPSKNLQFPRDKSQCCPHSFFGSTKKLLLRTHLIWLFQLLICTAQWDGVMVTQSDYQSLQAFKHELIDTEGFLKSWNDSGEGACSGGWIGIKCAQGQVIVIQLPWKGLGGKISESIGQFQALRKLSLHDNLLQGPIPLSLGFLRNLRGIQLFNNKLSGSIPHSLGSCPLLQTLDFSNNSLTGEIPGGIFGSANLSGLNLSFNSLFGSIPSEIGRLYKLTTLDLSNAGINGSLPVSLSNLSSLSVLNLQGNRLSGQIPATFGRISSLTELDLAYNNLSGEIPSSLGDLPKLAYFNASYNNFSGSVPTHLYQKFNSSSFVGNLHLCGYTASTPCPPPASPAHIPGRSAETNRTHHRRHDSRNIIFIGFGIFIVVVLCFLVLCYLTRKTAVSKVKDSQPGGKAGRARPEKGGEGGGETGGKLVRFEGPVALTEEGLFSAMAEALGKSTYGTAYKATMEDGKQLAVKRLRAKLTKSRKELEAEVKLLGKIRHPNLLALRAYYFGPRGDKLLVFDFMPRGSLARLLHAQRPGMPLDWPTRVKIVRGTAQGLLYLHAHVKIVHGNLTSSNVLLDEQMNPKVSDYALSRLMVGEANANAILAAEALGYWAPELSRLENANMKTDVYSLGVIVLELVTGKSPTEARNNGMDLPRWVASAMEERKVNEVFDPKLRKHTSVVQNELIETLKLALHCVNLLPSARPDVEQVLQRVEEIRPENGATKVWQ